MFFQYGQHSQCILKITHVLIDDRQANQPFELCHQLTRSTLQFGDIFSQYTDLRVGKSIV